MLMRAQQVTPLRLYRQKSLKSVPFTLRCLSRRLGTIALPIRLPISREGGCPHPPLDVVGLFAHFYLREPARYSTYADAGAHPRA
jgi:hypothetical protein